MTESAAQLQIKIDQAKRLGAEAGDAVTKARIADLLKDLQARQDLQRQQGQPVGHDN